MSDQKVGLVIEFESVEKMAEFMDDMRYHSVLPKDSAVFHRDGLDPEPEFILKRKGSRPDEWRATVTITEAPITREV